MKWFTTKFYNDSKEHLALFTGIIQWHVIMGKFFTSWPVKHQIRQRLKKKLSALTQTQYTYFILANRLTRQITECIYPNQNRFLMNNY